MCILTLALNSLPDFPVLLFFNRDERFGRQTTPLQRQPDKVVCALDVEAGGTWMAVATSGNLAALTNVRSQMPKMAGLQSRGQLVRRVLAGDVAALASQSYAAFNLLHGTLRLGSPSALTLSASTPADRGTGAWRIHSVPIENDGREPAVYAKTNDSTGLLTESTSEGGDRAWPKARWLRREVEQTLRGAPESTGEEGAKQLLRLIEPVISATSLPPAEAAEAESTRGEYSHVSADLERQFQRAPYILPVDLMEGAAEDPEWYGTVSQSAVFLCRSEQCVWFAYRETARPAAIGPADHGPWQWQRIDINEGTDG